LWSDRCANANNPALVMIRAAAAALLLKIGMKDGAARFQNLSRDSF